MTARIASLLLCGALNACQSGQPQTTDGGSFGDADSNDAEVVRDATLPFDASHDAGDVEETDASLAQPDASQSNDTNNDSGAPIDHPDAEAGPTHWRPTAGLSWQWQLSEEVRPPLLDVDVYDIDWEADADTVALLHSAGIKVICYVSVGSWEDFRPDADDFPAQVIGNDYEGWPGEKYVDIRSPVLRQIVLTRFEVCKQKGFDAIEPDNMDVFELGNDSGFPLTEADGIEYAEWLAQAAHERGLGIGQKNATSITRFIESSYDWALTESCYSDGNWCGDVSSYVEAGKAVFMCEYDADSFGDACATWQSEHYSPILKSLDLDAPVTFCE